MEIFISDVVFRKLKERHAVSEDEIFQCFQRLKTKFAYDTRDRNRTTFPTLWFIAETNTGRRLKVVFVRYGKDKAAIKTAYEPNDFEEKLYRSYVERG